MAAFDTQIESVAAYVEDLRAKGRAVREFACPSSIEKLTDGLPVRLGPGANPRIVLRSDTFVELGSPAAGSCALLLWTDRPSLLGAGRITLIGPDIPEAPGGSLPFGQVVMVGGAVLGAAEYVSISAAQYVADQIEGYMVKSSSRNLWGRVSKDAAAKGFCFETLGRSLMALFKTSVPAAEAVEIVFVTSSKEDLTKLEEITGQVREAGREILREQWRARGYDLDCDLHCGSCAEKQVCDDLRKITAAELRGERRRAGDGESPRRAQGSEKRVVSA